MASQYVPYSGAVVTRQAARSVSATRYFTGNPCKRGHFSQRMVSNGRCMACYYAMRKPKNDKERATARVWRKKWWAETREVRRAKKRAHYARNAKAINAREEARRKRAPQGQATSVRNYRARKRAAQGRHSKTEIAAILKTQGGKCAYCRAPLRTRFHVDHIIPLARGGANDRRNLQLTCRSCNQRKGALDPMDFARSVGLLV